MRIGGLATGMDIDELVNKLMSSERIPLDKMQQDKTILTWKQDSFREIYTKLDELDRLMYDMKLSKTYNPKTVSSTLEGAVTATASSSASNGTYEINVSQLAKNAINVSSDKIGITDPDAELSSDKFGEFKFYTFNEDGEAIEHKFEVKEGDTLNSVLKRISSDNNNVRAFYDKQLDKVIMETTRTGNYNTTDKFNGKEIGFGTDNTFFTDVLKMNLDGETGGTDAKFTYNGMSEELTSKSNSYTLNGVTFNFSDVTDGKNAKLTVTNDVDAAFDKIMKFVDTYNQLVDKMNGTQQEKRNRDFKPLTEEQKKEMSEKEIELWEEKAKSGLLRGETLITNGLFSMRQSWYSNVDTGGAYTSLTQIGITTSKDYMNGGKLEVNEDDLKKALREDPEAVQKLFSNKADDSSEGIINRLEKAVESTMKKIEERAGKSYSTLETYTIGKQMKDLNERISDFERRLVQVETRYWNQFSAMEKAIQRMNQQSTYLMNQFGG